MLTPGEDIDIEFRGQQAVATSTGATLRAYSVDGRAVLDGFGAGEEPPAGNGQVLMPWPNRIADGRYVFSGERRQLPINEPKLGHAIHGLVRWAPWSVETRTPDAVRFRHRLDPSPGYPFELALSVEYRVSSAGLAVTFGAMNIGRAACPFGAGAHPYFKFGNAACDEMTLCVRAREWVEVDARLIPRGRKPVEGSQLDFRRPRAIGRTVLNHAFAGLERDDQGFAEVVLHHDHRTIHVGLDRAFDYAQLFTGDTLADVARRRHSVAIEPMTCAPDAFNSGDGLRVLAPGESLSAAWSVRVSDEPG